MIGDIAIGIRNGLEYALVKYTAPPSQTIKGILILPSGETLESNTLPPIPRPLISPELSNILNKYPDNRNIKVSILFRTTVQPPTRNSNIVSTITLDGETRYFTNDRDDLSDIALEGTSDLMPETTELDRQDILAENDQFDILQRNFAQARETEIERNVAAFIERFSIPLVQIENNSISRQLVIATLTKKQILEVKASAPDNVLHIEPYAEEETSINNAVQWSGINDHARFTPHRGNGVGIWQTEPECAQDGFPTLEPNFVSNGTNSNSGNSQTAVNVRHAEDMATIMRVVSPDSFIECRTNPGSVLPTQTDLNNALQPIRLMSRSASFTAPSVNYGNNDALYDETVRNLGILILNAAGNRIAGRAPFNNNVSSGGRGLNVLTIGNANINNTPATRAGTSRFVNPPLQYEKPEVMAPGLGTSLPLLGRGTGGTSAATAHAAGFLANLMESNPFLATRPMIAKAQMMSGATTNMSGSQNQIGYGGINYRDTSQFVSTFGGNFSDNAQSLTFLINLNINKPNVRAVLTWANDGMYTLSQGSLSADWDLTVKDPTGNIVATGSNHVNPWELVDFTITQSGVYRFDMTRFALQNPTGSSQLGLAINWDD